MNPTAVLHIPVHIGIIMDGNRRWAKSRGLPTVEGHYAGHKAAKRVVEACFEQGIQYVTLYAFSNENWRRGAEEVSYLMRRLAVVVSQREIQYYKKQQICIKFLGRRDRIERSLLKSMERVEAETSELTRGTLCICLDYSGQLEIVDAAKRCLEDGLSADEITDETMARRMYAPDVPVIDVIVRTSGEQRLSNFMLWRAAYSELFFIEKLWPDMTKDDVTDIIRVYNQRSRRFGG